MSEKVKIGNKDVAVKELGVADSTDCDASCLESIEKIIDKYQSWDKSGFELIIENPKLFNRLIRKSTGKSKKFIKSLSAKEYDLLAFVFLSVNAEFFIQRLKLIQLVK